MTNPFKRKLQDYPPDIHEKISRDFGVASEAARQMVTVHLESEPLSDRVLQCVLFVAAGSVDELQRRLDLAKFDYRDMIMEAEYDHLQRQIRNFNEPFV